MSATMNLVVLLIFLCSMGGFILGRVMKWKRVWLISLIIFLFMIVAIFLLWYCFPEVWKDIIEQLREAW